MFLFLFSIIIYNITGIFNKVKFTLKELEEARYEATSKLHIKISYCHHKVSIKFTQLKMTFVGKVALKDKSELY